MRACFCKQSWCFGQSVQPKSLRTLVSTVNTKYLETRAWLGGHDKLLEKLLDIREQATNSRNLFFET